MHCVLFIQRVLTRAFHADLVILVEVDALLQRLKDLVLVFWQWWWYIHRNTFPIS